MRLVKALSLTIITIIFVCQKGYTQDYKLKSLLNDSTTRDWPSFGGLQNCKISNDGNFLSYSIQNLPNPGDVQTVLQTLNKSLLKQYTNIGSSVQFTVDSKKAILLKGDNTLNIISAHSGSELNLEGVKSFKLSEDSNGQWLAFQTNDLNPRLILRNLSNDKELTFSSVNFYVFSSDECIFIQNDPLGKKRIVSLDLRSEKATLLWSGRVAKSMVLSSDKKKIAFIGQSMRDSLEHTSILSYDCREHKLETLISSPFISKGKEFSVYSILGFSPSKDHLYYKATNLNSKKKVNIIHSKIDIWSYQDKELQALQLIQKDFNVSEFVVSNNGLINLNVDGMLYDKNGFSDEYVIVNRNKTKSDEAYWNKLAKPYYQILSLRDTSKIYTLSGNINSATISPSGKFCVYFDIDSNDWKCLNLSSGDEKSITADINTTWTSYNRSDDATWSKIPIGLAGWLDADKKLLVYDRYDIYLLDLQGREKYINLTNGYGRRKNISFRLALAPEGKYIQFLNSQIIICAFNRENKENGFFKLDFRITKDPQKLVMIPKLLVGTSEDFIGNLNLPVRAKNAKVYLVQQESEKESPNLYWTSDFKVFKAITNIYPERKFNWYTAQIIKWKTLDGDSSQGILYKPENFDKNRRYPLIIVSYEKFSDGLHRFDYLKGNEGSNINISNYVSNGYLILVPDIQFKMGNPGLSALNTILGAINELSKYSWLNERKIGLNGHSFGAYETNYLITHTNIFAAACANSGWSNFTSSSNRIRTSGVSALYYYEKFRQRMDANMWERPDLYIQASPIFQAYKVSTPLLMMNNKGDTDVDFPEGIQFFLALRRLGKKVWMLQYDYGKHSLTNPEDIKDLNVRMRQFFDHYLKDAPAPKWMTRGVPALMKGIDDGLEFDFEIKTPIENILTEEAKKKSDSLLNRKPITVEIK